MKIGVLGCGAIGGLLAARLADAGETVTVVDLPEVVRAVGRRGLTLVDTEGNATTRPVRAVHSGAEAGPQDVVLLAVKANQLADASPDAVAMLRRGTMVVTPQNGIPWWYFQREGGRFDGRRLRSADPEGRLAAAIPAADLLGCVAYPAAVVEEPGVVRHVEGNRFPLGELDGSETGRAMALAGAFDRAGFRARLLPHVRAELWLKAVGSAAFNPLSAVTGLTMAEIAEQPETRARALELMREAEAVANSLGVVLRVTVEQRLEGARAVGHHKTSMLQDVEAGRPTERAALVDTIVEIGEWVGVETAGLAGISAEVERMEG